MLLEYFKFFLLTIFSISVIIWVLQAVNFMDFIVEDGHGLFVYLNFTILNFPRIFSKIFTFAIFFSFFYILLKYEDKNELVIFWNIGIHKITFIRFFIKISYLFLIAHLLLNTLVVPKSQDLARSFLRASDLDFFEGIIKPKKFITATKDLTIFVDDKKENGNLVNIFLKENNAKDFQIIFAKTGRFEKRGNRKILVLFNGQTINKQNNTLSGFEFTQSDFNLSKFNSITITSPKTQENSTVELIKCIQVLNKMKSTQVSRTKSFNFDNCKLNNLKNILKELHKRMVSPFYNTLLIMIALILILRSKNEHTFRFYKIKIFILGVSIIIFSEIILKFINTDTHNNIIIVLIPFILMFLLYAYYMKKLKVRWL